MFRAGQLKTPVFAHGHLEAWSRLPAAWSRRAVVICTMVPNSALAVIARVVPLLPKPRCYRLQADRTDHAEPATKAACIEHNDTGGWRLADRQPPRGAGRLDSMLPRLTNQPITTRSVKNPVKYGVFYRTQ